MKAKVFICQHPGELVLLKNLAIITRQYSKESRIILLKVSHRYFQGFNLEPYRQFFDEILEFDFVNYEKNFFKGFRQIANFIGRIKKVSRDISADFEEIDLFLGDSAWLPANILLRRFSGNKNIKNITRFTFGGAENPQVKQDRLRTFLCNLYGFPFGVYKIKALSTKQGKFVDFAFAESVPGNTAKIVGPREKYAETDFPYPVVSRIGARDKKDRVIIFGDESISRCYSEYLPDYETFLGKLAGFFKALEKKYERCKLYYKPHPGDGKRTMPGIDPEKYEIIVDNVSAQEIFDDQRNNIRAVYAFSSSSVAAGSFFGIPSYTFYRYVANQAGIEKFDAIFGQAASKYLFHISNLKEIGKIDNLKRSNPKNIYKQYRGLLRV